MRRSKCYLLTKERLPEWIKKRQDSFKFLVMVVPFQDHQRIKSSYTMSFLTCSSNQETNFFCRVVPIGLAHYGPCRKINVGRIKDHKIKSSKVGWQCSAIRNDRRVDFRPNVHKHSIPVLFIPPDGSISGREIQNLHFTPPTD